LSIEPVKAIKLVSHDFLFRNPCGVLPITLFSIMFGNSYQHYLFHQIPMDPFEPDQLVIPQILLPDRKSDSFFLPVLEELLQFAPTYQT